MSDGEPDAVDALGERPPAVAGAELAGDGGGGAVGQEDAQPDRRSAARAPAMPRPASCGVPRWPTMAASASRKSGSATRARKAGTASRRISRSVVRARAPLGRARHGCTRAVSTCREDMAACGYSPRSTCGHRRMLAGASCRQTNAGRPDDETGERPIRADFRCAQAWPCVCAGQRRSVADVTVAASTGLVNRCAQHAGVSSTGPVRVIHRPCGQRWCRGLPAGRTVASVRGCRRRGQSGHPVAGRGVRQLARA